MSLVELQFLGSGDAMGSGGRFQACLSLRTGRRRLLVDCGATAMVAARRFGIDPDEVEAIAISHLHGDHFAGLPFFLLDARYVSRRTRPLVVAGPSGVERRVLETMERMYPGSVESEQSFELSFVEIEAGREIEIGPASLRAETVVHRSGAPAYGFRIDLAGRRISYSGDTGWTDALCRLAAGADVFVCEASFYDLGISQHLDYVTLLAHRTELDCRRILLTHLGGDMLARSDLEFEVAHDGLQIEI